MPEDPGLPDAEGRSPTVNVLASRAAAAALSGPQVSPGQWVYRSCAVVATPDNASSPVIVERWATADNTVAAAYQDGQLRSAHGYGQLTRRGTSEGGRSCSRPSATAALNSLPGTPDALVALLAETPVPGEAVARRTCLRADRRALPDIRHATGDHRAALPGPRCDQRRDSQPARHRRGRTSRHRLPARRHRRRKPEIIADPGTWQFQGYQFLGDGRDVRAPGAWGMAILRQALVPAPGTRPPEQPAPSNL